ncbi:MAG: hypothetical protein HY903_24215 [Deltaproteobacteria bacterium]|nr:hypothetical protein [Deltaproteobacteria bacterium]
MSDPFKDLFVTANFGIGAGGSMLGLSFLGLSVRPARSSPGNDPFLVPEDGRKAWETLGLAALGTVGTGMLIRALKNPNESATKPKDLLLDGLVGLQLGSGLVGDPRAEAFFLSGIVSLPLQWLNYRRDPSWDYRVGMLTQGAVGVAREQLGGQWIPNQGWRVNPQVPKETETVFGELIGNAAAEIALDAVSYGLGNSLAALAQGTTRPRELGARALQGAAYGGAEALLTTLSLGPAVRIRPETMAAALKIDGLTGPDVADVANHTTFRAGALILGLPIAGITLGPNVSLDPTELNNPVLIAHELIHRDQMAGATSAAGPGTVREGHGVLSFYGQYLVWSAQNTYINNPFEREAYHFADHRSYVGSPAVSTESHGDVIGMGAGMLLFGGGSLLMAPKPRHPATAPAAASTPTPDPATAGISAAEPATTESATTAPATTAPAAGDTPPDPTRGEP